MGWGKACLEERHDVEFPGCGWVFAFDRYHLLFVLVFFLGEVDWGEGTFA